MRSVFQDSFVLLSAILVLDLVFGDPRSRWHPVVLLGGLVTALENDIRGFGWNGRAGGILLFFLLLLLFLSPVLFAHALFAKVHWTLGWLWYAVVGWNMLSLRSLLDHSRDIRLALEKNDLDAARVLTARLVGRDTEQMDEKACGRAAIESVSENLTDGVISPLFYFLIAGVPGMVVYKIASTLDSMIGYKNARYFYFGWFGARLDDVLNFIPARLTWLLVVAVAWVHPKLSGKKAWRVGVNQHGILPSPNSGWPEAGAAGALKTRLVGPIYYGGKKVTDLWLGEDEDPEGGELSDIRRMNELALWVTGAFLLLAFCVTGLWSR